MIKKYLNKNFLAELFIYNTSMSGLWASIFVSPVYIMKENSPYFILTITMLISGLVTLMSLYKKEFNQYNQKIYFYIHFIAIFLLYTSLLVESQEYFYFTCFLNLMSSFVTVVFSYTLPQKSLNLFSLEKNFKDIMPENSENFIKEIMNSSYTLVESKFISNSNILYITNLNKYIKIINIDEIHLFLVNKSLKSHNLTVQDEVSVYIGLLDKKDDSKGINLIDLYQYVKDNNFKIRELSEKDLEIINMCKI